MVRHTPDLLMLDSATHPGLLLSDSATHPGCCCLMVRHTPAFGHPSPRGDGAAAAHWQLWVNGDNQSDAAAHPLSERGWRGSGTLTVMGK